MDLTRSDRIEEILQAALELDPAAQSKFVRESCGGDEELRREVDSLLQYDSRAVLLSDRPAVAWVAEQLASEAPPLAIGQLLGRYRVERRIGAGGMGEVYEARDETLQRLVAIKVLPAELTDPESVQRFEQEALAASKLNHPNIITIHEIVHAEGIHFIVAERVEGETLRALLADPLTRAPRKLEISRALDIAIQVAKALGEAHGASIIHRDIKPENLMVRSDGVVKVLDFGIAKVRGATDRSEASSRAADSDLTIPGAVLGTASYMSPEQMRGEPLDDGTDLFSLGVVLYEMVSGERPFTGAARAETTTVQLDRTLPATNRLGHLPRELQRIIRKMLEPEREARHRSANELLDDLAVLKQHIDGRRSRIAIRVAGAAAALLFLVAVVSAYLSYTETWEERVLRDGHTAAVQQAVFSPDGRLVASCSEDGQVIVWDFARRQRLKTLPLVARKLAFSPDGRWLAIGGGDGAVTIWDAERWQRTRVIPIHRTEIGGLGFSPDGSLLAAAGYGRTSVWRTRDWTKLYEWDDGGYGAFVFSPDLRQLLYGRGFYYDLDTGRRIRSEPMDGASWMTLTSDGVAALTSEGYLELYRPREWGRLDGLELIGRSRGHRDNGRCVAISPDKRFLATAAEDILLWDAATREKIARFEYPSIVWSVAFSPDGKWLISSHADGAVLVWDVAERERVFSFNEHSGGVRAVAFSPDGRTIASASEDRAITLWEPRLGRKIAVLTAHATRVSALAFSRLTGRFASADYDGNVAEWDLGKRQPRLMYSTGRAGLCLALSPDGRHLATTRGVYTAGGRRVVSFEETTIPNAKHHAFPNVYGVSFSGDGRVLAAVTEGGLVMIWDARTWRLLAMQRVPSTSQIAVSLSADGKQMITGEDEGAVRLWSVAPLRQKAILGRHAARVKSVAFSPDGATAVSAGDDKMIALWDIGGQKLRTRIGTHTSPVYSVAFSPDGRQLVSGEHDRSVRLYTRQRTVWGFPIEPRWTTRSTTPPAR